MTSTMPIEEVTRSKDSHRQVVRCPGRRLFFATKCDVVLRKWNEAASASTSTSLTGIAANDANVGGDDVDGGDVGVDNRRVMMWRRAIRQHRITRSERNRILFNQCFVFIHQRSLIRASSWKKKVPPPRNRCLIQYEHSSLTSEQHLSWKCNETNF